MDGLTVNLGASGGSFPVRRTADPVPFPRGGEVSGTPAESFEDVSVEKLEGTRFKAVKEAAVRSFPPSNQRFTIYKDPDTGKFVTFVRFTDTGETIQIPEPKMLERLALDGASLFQTLI